MQDALQGASVQRDDGVRGTVTKSDKPGQLTVVFGDGASLVVMPDALVRQPDGSYRLSQSAANLVSAVAQPDEVVIPVVAEELTVEKELVERGKVHVHKRIETREQVVNTPTFREDVRVEHVAINKYVDDVVPEVREEDGVLVIPIIEEVVVIEKRLLLREEVRVFKHRTEVTDTQTVTLRREIVDIEKEDLSDSDQPKKEP